MLRLFPSAIVVRSLCLAALVTNMGCPAATPCSTDADCTGEDVCRTDPDSGELTCGVPNATAQPRTTISEFSASPSPINVGESSTLSWTTENAETCTLTNSVTDSTIDVDVNGSLEETPGATIDYTLTCEGGTNVATATASIVVDRPVSIEDFSVNVAAINLRDSATLSWSTLNAVQCTIFDGVDTQNVENVDTLEVTPDVTTTYTLRCTGYPQEVEASVVVTVVGVSEVNVSATLVVPPATIEVDWVYAGAGECAVLLNDDVIAGNAVSASFEITTPGIYEVVVSCDGSQDGVVEGSRQVFAAGVESFSVAPNPVAANGDIDLTWVAIEVDGCEVQRVDGTPTTVAGGLAAAGTTQIATIAEAQDLQLVCQRAIGQDAVTATSDVVSVTLQ